MAKTAEEHWFSKFASETATKSGRPWAFGIAGGFVAGWLVTGPHPALQLKLDELIRATEARNRLIGIERLPELDLESVREKIEKKETP